MIYDQSLEVEIPSRKAKFLANFRYNKKASVTPNMYATLTSASYDKFDSQCNETMVGVKFGTDDKKIQCWVGHQTEPFTTKTARENKIAAAFILAQTEANAESMVESKSRTHAGKF